MWLMNPVVTQEDAPSFTNSIASRALFRADRASGYHFPKFTDSLHPLISFDGNTRSSIPTAISDSLSINVITVLAIRVPVDVFSLWSFEFWHWHHLFNSVLSEIFCDGDAAYIIAGINVCASVSEQFHYLRVTFKYCFMQRSVFLLMKEKAN